MGGSGSNGDTIDIAIIGAGIGGAATALALREAGLEAEIFEQAAALGEVGGGIVVREPSRALLAQWNILDGLKPKMVRVENLEIRQGDGTVLTQVPAAIEGGETHTAHRADVHAALVSRLPPARLHLGHRLATVRNGDDFAEATFENGRRIRARLIIGADGLRSAVRALIDTSPMQYQKQVTNRTIAPASILPAGMPNDRIRVWQSGERRLIMLPIRGGTEVTLNAAIPAETAPEKLWSWADAAALGGPVPPLGPVVAPRVEGGTVPITTHPVYDKEPIPRWADRHVVLLGDAAHPMSPMNGQGANQAMQDAGALAAALVSHGLDGLDTALAEYQAIRAPATAHIQMLSRKPLPAMVKVAPASS